MRPDSGTYAPKPWGEAKLVLMDERIMTAALTMLTESWSEAFLPSPTRLFAFGVIGKAGDQ